MTARRFPQPWSTEDNGACFIVKDNNGQPLAYVYYEEEAGRRSAAKLLTRDEARRVAANIAKLPHLLTKKILVHAEREIRCGGGSETHLSFINRRHILMRGRVFKRRQVCLCSSPTPHIRIPVRRE